MTRSPLHHEFCYEEVQISRRSTIRLIAYGILAFCVVGISVTGCAEFLFYHPTQQPTPPPTVLSFDAVKVNFESEDGTKLCGWFIPTRRGDTKKEATVLHLHGNAGSMLEHIFFVEWMPSAGFNVFMFDYRGYGESEGKASWREDLLADSRAALKTLRARTDIDQTRVAVYGQSLGGALATVLVAQDSGAENPIRALALESPFCSWREIAANTVGGEPPAWYGSLLAWLLIRDGTRAVPRPDEAIGMVECPVLIVHGDADAIIPVGHGRALAPNIRNGKLVEYAGGQHNNLQETHPLARNALNKFLKENTNPKR